MLTVDDLARARRDLDERGEELSLVCVIPGLPLPRARPRLATIPAKGWLGPRSDRRAWRAIAYDDESAELRAVALQQRAQLGVGSVPGPCVVEVLSVFGVPPSWPVWRREEALAGRVPHTAKPDADNLAKAQLDALTRAGVWADDAHVVSLTAQKAYGAEPGTLIVITPLRPAPQRKAHLDAGSASKRRADATRAIKHNNDEPDA